MSVRHVWLAALVLGPLCFLAAAEGMPSLHGSAATAYLKKEGVYNSLGEAVQTAIYGAHPDTLGFAAPNPEQDFVARFSEAGLKIDGVGWKSSWRLRSVGYGERQAAVGPARIEAHGIHIEMRRGGGVTEWYVNGARGLEQGFTLQRPPSEEGSERRAGERLRLTIDVAGDLKAREAGEGIELVRGDGTVGLHYEHLVVKDAKGRTLGARMGVAEGAVWVEVEDAGAAWPVTVDPTFTQQALLVPKVHDVDDQVGYSLAISGDTVVVGVPGEDSNAKGVDHLPLQTDNSALNSGAAYVFVRSSPPSWSQQAYLKASNTEAGDRFGSSVAVWGDTFVIGAEYESSSATGVNGNQADNNAFGAGAAYVFERKTTVISGIISLILVDWTQQAYLKASNTGGIPFNGFNDFGDHFGASVAVSGDTIVVGARYEDSSARGVNGDQSNDNVPDSGAAYVFVRSGVAWSQQAYLKPSNTGAGAQKGTALLFGSSVAVADDTVVVGAPYEHSSATGVNGNQNDDSAAYAGAAYVFTRNGATWSQQAYVKASNTKAGEGDVEFGFSVAVSGDTVVVGASRENSSATGVNGDQSNNNAIASGAAYVFVRNGTAWSQQAYLKASNTAPNGQFGFSVGVSGATVVVGAPFQDNSGAAYVFVRNGALWSQQDYLQASVIETNSGFGGSAAVSNDTVVIGAGKAQFGNSVSVFRDPSVRITDIRSITDFGDVPNFTSGSWLQIKGLNLYNNLRSWQWSDFNGNNAPTTLDDVTVLFNGQPGFISFMQNDKYASPSQINVQAPANLPDGPVNVVVTNLQGISNTFIAQKTPLAPGMLALAKFNVGGKQYLPATFHGEYLFVGNENLAPGAPFRPAKPGDLIWTYGIGFGDTTPYVPPGVIPMVPTQLNAQVQFQFGPALVTPSYSGFYTGYIGLDLFALVVPDVPDGDHLITVLVNGQPLPQTLYLTVKR